MTTEPSTSAAQPTFKRHEWVESMPGTFGQEQMWTCQRCGQYAFDDPTSALFVGTNCMEVKGA